MKKIITLATVVLFALFLVMTVGASFVKALTVSTSAIFTVQGIVSSSDGSKLAGLRVLIINKSISRVTILSEAVTDSRGQYAVRFPGPRQGEKFNILVQLFSGQTLLATSEVRNNASSQEVINFQIESLKPLKDIAYPVKELGNCGSKGECKQYCDVKANITKCLDYGVKTGLMSQSEVLAAEAVIQTSNGPAGCTDQESCAKVCESPANTSACLEYAKKNNLMTDDELEKAKKVAGIISSGTKTPGGCQTPQACRQYCMGGSHVEECISFAKGVGLISGEEAKEIEKGGDFLKNGGPGGCKSREACESYCKNNQSECEAFFKNAGVADSKFREKSGKPPETGGGAVCTTREECEAFCKNPANSEACKNVVIKQNSTGAGPEIKGDPAGLLRNINQMPRESTECLKQALGAETFEKLMKGEIPTTPINGDVMQSCFAKGVKEYEKKMMPTNKPDDFSTDYGPGPSTDHQLNQGGVPRVQGTSTRRSLLDIILGWFR